MLESITTVYIQISFDIKSNSNTSSQSTVYKKCSMDDLALLRWVPAPTMAESPAGGYLSIRPFLTVAGSDVDKIARE